MQVRPAQQITMQVSVCSQLAACLPCRPAVVEDARREVSTSGVEVPLAVHPACHGLRLLFQLCRPVKLVGVIVGGWAAETLAPYSEANAAQCMSGMALTSSPLGAELRAQLAARDPMHPLLRQVNVCSQARGRDPGHAALTGLLG